MKFTYTIARDDLKKSIIGQIQWPLGCLQKSFKEKVAADEWAKKTINNLDKRFAFVDQTEILT